MTDSEQETYLKLRFDALGATARLHGKVKARHWRACLIKQSEAAHKLREFEDELKLRKEHISDV